MQFFVSIKNCYSKQAVGLYACNQQVTIIAKLFFKGQVFFVFGIISWYSFRKFVTQCYFTCIKTHHYSYQ